MTQEKNDNIKTAEPTSEDRLHQRVPIQLLVDYQAGGNYLFDFCRDLGSGGIFIETPNPQPTGSEVELTFTLPDSKETLEVKGEVIWSQKAEPSKDIVAGMGVQFKNYDSTSHKLLEEFVRRYHKNAS